MNNKELLKNLNENFHSLYEKYLISEEFKKQIILNEDNPLFEILENHNYVIKKTQDNLKELKIIIDKLNNYFTHESEVSYDKNMFLTIYLECQNILENINELDISVDKHRKIFLKLT